MNNNFCERFILRCNPELTEKDLMLLDILSEKYDIFLYKDVVLKYNINCIISRIILGLLPYEVAIKIILGPNEFPIVVKVDNQIIYTLNSGLSGQEYVDKEIERMNAFIKLKQIENER